MRLRFAEMLEQDGSLHVANLRTARPQETYVLRGGGREVFEPRFTFHGFRYVEVQGPRRSAPTLVGRVVHSDTPWTGRFECSSDLVNQLWRNVTWGQRGNFLSVPTDCPQRDERLGWLADAQVFLPSAALNMDVAAFITKWGDDILDAQSADGAYPDVAPRLGAERDGAPAWGDAGIIVPWTIYQRYGDVRILERHWDAMERYVAYLVAPQPGPAVDARAATTTTATGCRSARTRRARCSRPRTWPTTRSSWRASRGVLGRADREAHYERAAPRRRRARSTAPTCARTASSKATRRPSTCWRCTWICCRTSCASARRERLVADIERHDWHLTTGFVGVGLLCPVLTEAGYADVAYRLLLNETFPSWGYSIRHGATTIWERWDGWTDEHGFQTPLMNSFNHYSLGSVAQWLYEYVAGIRLDPERPGLRARGHRPRARRSRVGTSDVPLCQGADQQRVAPGGRHLPARRRDPGERHGHGHPARRRETRGRLRAPELHAPRGRQSESSFARARARSSERVRTPSLVYTWPRWNSTVFVLNMSSSATSRFVMPDTTSRATASS